MTHADDASRKSQALRERIAVLNAAILRISAVLDLEVLVETSPVGFVVFEAQGGRTASFNREARRIVQSLRLPGCPSSPSARSNHPARRSPLADSETVRADKVVLSLPDGRGVRMLVNTRTFCGGGNEIPSVLVTMQDLPLLDEIERMRTEFLSLVSHERREFHRIVVERARHMRGLISDLQDTGRIDSGTLSVAPEPAGFTALVERACSA